MTSELRHNITRDVAKSWGTSASEAATLYPCSQAPDLFYPEMGQDYGDARKLCMMCPARIECLIVALERPEVAGMWGGLAPWERARLRRA